MEEKFVIEGVNSVKIISEATGETILEGSYIGTTDYTLNTRLDRDGKNNKIVR